MAVLSVLSKKTLYMLLLYYLKIKRRQKYKKRMWVRKLFRERKSKGAFSLFIKDMQLFDHKYFFKFFRMTPTKYEHFLSLIAPVITKSSLRRETIGASERLMVTLRYIFGGTSQIDLAGMFRISPTSIGRIINETSIAIWTILLSKEYISYPKSEDEWKFIANEFERKWNFSNCIGAIDGKHIVMQAPSKSGSFFFNYEKSHSVVLMAICNANYEFTLVDIGDTGRNSDGGVFGNSKMGIAFETKLLHIPEPTEPSGSSIKLPYVLIGDEAFPLKNYLMKPYPREILSVKERIYNYRLSRAHRIIENTFGILAARCRVFRKPVIAKEEVVINVTKAATALHNYLMHGRQFEPINQYCPSKFVDYETSSGLQAGEWRSNISDYQGLTNLQKQLGSNNYTCDAKTFRESFRDFFSSPQGQIPWQYDMVTRTQNTFDQE